MTGSQDWSGLFEPIYAATPWPMLMLGEDGIVLGASDEAGAGPTPGAPPTDAALRDRAQHYLTRLHGDPPWLTPQEADSERTLPSGEVLCESLHLRRTAWGACLTIVARPDPRQAQADRKSVV